MERYSDYDPFAWLYDRYWGGFWREIMPRLEKSVLHELPRGARILDLCCGTGELARVLFDGGYQVTGLDGSEEMLRHARQRAPGVGFVHADAREFAFSEPFQAVLCTYDSLNHVLEPEGLAEVFRRVWSALDAGGLFFFDLNMDAGFRERWHSSYSIVEDDHAAAVRSSYDADKRLGRCAVTMFVSLEGRWERSDVVLTQRAYSEEQVTSALYGAGFETVETDGGETGRLFLLARKS